MLSVLLVLILIVKSNCLLPPSPGPISNEQRTLPPVAFMFMSGYGSSSTFQPIGQDITKNTSYELTPNNYGQYPLCVLNDSSYILKTYHKNSLQLINDLWYDVNLELQINYANSSSFFSTVPYFDDISNTMMACGTFSFYLYTFKTDSWSEIRLPGGTYFNIGAENIASYYNKDTGIFYTVGSNSNNQSIMLIDVWNNKTSIYYFGLLNMDGLGIIGGNDYALLSGNDKLNNRFFLYHIKFSTKEIKLIDQQDYKIIRMLTGYNNNYFGILSDESRYVTTLLLYKISSDDTVSLVSQTNYPGLKMSYIENDYFSLTSIIPTLKDSLESTVPSNSFKLSNNIIYILIIVFISQLFVLF